MPKTLGKYEIIRTLGQGAMGEVYLAHHPAIGREVAIKTILQSAAKGEDAEDRFRREATAAGKLNHPNLVTIFDFDKDEDVLYLVMEFVKGDDLADLIEKKSLNQSQFLEILAQVCDGLSYAHRAGIIHRDIKPANVRVIQDGKRILAKVMDFGIARIEDSNMTATGIVMGTVSYMAPEYIRNGKASPQSDLFAVGVMLYECLSGRKPFAGDNTTTILFKIVSENPQPIEPAVIQGISPSIRAILDRALSKDPAQRFQTGDDLAKALRACKDPTWNGTVEEATSRISSKQMEDAYRDAQAMAMQYGAPPQAGYAPTPEAATMMMNQGAPPPVQPYAPTQMMPQGGYPPAPPTQMMPQQPNYGAPTQMMPQGYGMPPVQPGYPQPTVVMQSPGYPTPTVVVQQAAHDSSKGKGGLYAIIGGMAVVLAAGGTWAFMSTKKSDAPTTPTTAAAPGALTTPGANPGGPAQAAPKVAASTNAVPQQSATTTAPVVAAPTPAKAEAPKVEAPKVEAAKTAAPPAPPPKPVEETLEQKLAKGEGMIGSNPGSAAEVLKPLAIAQPNNAQAQGLFLASLYRARRAGEFERQFKIAQANGLSATQMMSAAPAFKKAMVEELGAHRGKTGANILSLETLNNVLK